MSYKDKHSATIINIDKFDNLHISTEYDRDPSGKYPMFLFTPNMNNPEEHFHIPLSRYSARMLRDWLNEYLEDTEV